jgi:hypothetical protein
MAGSFSQSSSAGSYSSTGSYPLPGPSQQQQLNNYGRWLDKQIGGVVTQKPWSAR